MLIKTLHNIDTIYSADSIEWCTHPKYNNYFVCGTYQLEDDVETSSSSTTCQRKGRIYLFKFDKASKDVNELQRLDTAAILDMKWMPMAATDNVEQTAAVLAAADALGNIQVFQLQKGKLVLSCALNLNPDESNLLALSLDWNWPENNPSGSFKRQILASDSKGDISLINYLSSEKNATLELQKTWHAHGFEAWICAFDKWNSNVVYTGGDDSFLYSYDLRSYDRDVVNIAHIAGVTSLLSHSQHEHILLTGSYDENLRIFDTRRLSKPLGELNLKGGIWRLKSDPLNRNLILAACMYNNFSIVQLEQMNAPTLVAEYREHMSICYGADWCMSSKPEDDELFMATCSFYDHTMCVSSITDNKKD